MKTNPTLEKLVSLLGHSENDPEVIEILTELGVKLPLKRPKHSEDGYLIEKNKINCYLGVSYANSLPYIRDNQDFKEKELVFSDVQNILEENFSSFILPYGLKWEMNIDDIIKVLGENYYYSDSHLYYLWKKENIVIRIELYDDDTIYNIAFRWVWNSDLQKLNQ